MGIAQCRPTLPYTHGMASYPNDIIDGREVRPLVITADHVLTGVHQGTVHVEAGHLDLRGRINGTLSLQPGTRATISGTQAGTVNVGREVEVVVTGAINGTCHVHASAIVLVEPRGKLAGTLHNDGRVIVRGVFGGARSGSGDLVFEDQGYEKQPRIENGIRYYEW